MARSFVLQFDANSNAFEPDPVPEIARILCALAGMVEMGAKEGPILDASGARIGRFELAER